MKILDLLTHSIKNNLKHIPSALSQFSYLKYLLPTIKEGFNIVIGKPFGAQAYYCIWEEMGYIEQSQKLSYGVKHDELSFVEYSEETLGNALGIASGIALSSTKLTWCNISDAACQMGPTIEAAQFIGSKKIPMLLTIDCNNAQLTGNTNAILNTDSDKIKDMFEMYNWNIYVMSCYLYEISEDDLEQVIDMLKFDPKPTVIIFETIKGCGVTEMEDDPVGWHYRPLKNIKDVTICENT